MLPSARPARRAITGAIGTGALPVQCFSVPPPSPRPSQCLHRGRHRTPPACTAAELALVMSGVTFDTSNYLTKHPAVNDFFTSLKGQPRDQIRDQVQVYLDNNPNVRQDLQNIRQPSAAFRDRCGVPQPPMG